MPSPNLLNSQSPMMVSQGGNQLYSRGFAEIFLSFQAKKGWDEKFWSTRSGSVHRVCGTTRSVTNPQTSGW